MKVIPETRLVHSILYLRFYYNIIIKDFVWSLYFTTVHMSNTLNLRGFWWGVCVAHHFSFLCCHGICIYVLSSVL
jgi:hypothetical protein